MLAEIVIDTGQVSAHLVLHKEIITCRTSLKFFASVNISTNFKIFQNGFHQLYVLQDASAAICETNFSPLFGLKRDGLIHPSDCVSVFKDGRERLCMDAGNVELLYVLETFWLSDSD